MDSRLQLLGKSLDALPVNVSLLDQNGTIIQTNEAWREFGTRNGIRMDADTVGTNYLAVCERSSTETAEQARRGLEALLAGTRDGFQLEYPCHSPVEQRWFLLVAVPVTVDGQRHAVVAHINITEYKFAARQQERQLAHLEALTDLSAAIREITHVVIDQSTRPEIEATVCAALVESTGYDCAWIGDIDGRTGSISVTTSAGRCPAGVDDEFEGILGETIIRQAIWTHEVQTTATTQEEPAFDWRAESEQAYTERAVAAVPITHGGTLYSICCVYTDRSTAFGSDERAILSQLGAVVGHAIAASERTQALMSDELIEVELQIPELFAQPTPSPTDWAVDITQTIAVSDDEYIMYGTTTDDEINAVRSVFEPLDEIELSVIGGDPENLRIELRQFQQCVIPLLAAHGWSTEHAVLTNGDCYLTVHLPSGDDVRELVETVRELFPTVELLARQQIHADRQLDTGASESTVAELTERQRTILQTAYGAGYFEWPRDASGGEIAETLGISPPTFHQHLRVGQQKLMTAIFEELPITG